MLAPTIPVLSLVIAWLIPAAAAAAEPPAVPHAFEAGWQGRKTCEVLYEADTVRVARCSFPPGAGHERHYHEPHFGYVIEGGTMRIVDDTGERIVNTPAGTEWSTSERTVHEALNVGDTTTTYLIVEPR